MTSSREHEFMMQKRMKQKTERDSHMLRQISDLASTEDPTLKKVTRIPQSYKEPKQPPKRTIPLEGVFGDIFYSGRFHPSDELMRKEKERYKASNKSDSLMLQIRQIEDGLCRKYGVRRLDEGHDYVPNTMANGKNVGGHHALVMGNTTDDPQHPKMWGVSQLDRTFHTFCLGKTGSGKSTFLRGLLVQDLWYNRGGLLLEPHGDLSLELLEETPPYRLHNVIYMDTLGDNEYSPGFNPLAVPRSAWLRPDAETKDMRAQAVTSVVSLIAKHFSMDQGAVQLKKNLENALNALVWVPGATLLEVMDFYNNEDVRKTVLKCMPEGAEKERITEAAGKVKASDLGSLENRIAVFQNNMNMKRMFGQSLPTLNFYQLMNEGYTIICPLNKGVSDDDSFRNFVGAYIISSIYHDSMKREAIPQGDRVIFPLTIDEFQNFAGDDVAGMLSECRKYGLPLILANQYMAQLNGTVQTAVEQCGTKIYLQLTDADASHLSSTMENVSSLELANIPKFHSVVQTIRNSQTTDPFMSANLNLAKVEETLQKQKSSETIKNLVIELSHKRFMKSSAEIDKEIDKRHEMLADSENTTRDDLLREFVFKQER